MTRLGAVLALFAAAFVLPTAATSAPTKADTKAASKECHDLRAAMGKQNFNAQYGNFGKCVSKKAKEEAAERRAARAQARAACKQQGLKGKDYRECVDAQSTAIKAAADHQDKNRVNAAKACRAQQKADAAGFSDQWGDGKNAFGKCVSATARAKNDEDTAGES